MVGNDVEHVPGSRELLSIMVIASLVTAMAQIVRKMVTEALGPYADTHSWWFIQDVVGLQYSRNTGAGFGFFEGNVELLAGLSIIVGAALIWIISSEMAPGLPRHAATGLVLGGAVSNFIERLRDGYVTDYVAVGPWPRFNIADSAITVGLALFAISFLWDRSRNDNQDGEQIHGGLKSVQGETSDDGDRA